MAVHDGLNIGPRLVDLAVNEALEKTAAAICVDWVAFQIVLEDVAGGHQRRRKRSRHQVMAGRRRMAQRDVTEGIDNALRREDAARRCEICDERGGGFAAGFIRHMFFSRVYNNNGLRLSQRIAPHMHATYNIAMKTIQITMDEKLLSKLDADRETQRIGRSAVLRLAVTEYLNRRRRTEITRSYQRAYAAKPGLGGEFDGWEEEGKWPSE